VKWTIESFVVSERRACGLIAIQRSSFRYQSRAEDQTALRLRLKELAAVRIRFGYRRLTVLLRREGWKVNAKRIYRLYREEGLAVRTRKRKKTASRARVIGPPADGPNQRWSMDFMSDVLHDNRKVRTFNVLDDYNRQCLCIEVDTGLPALRITRILDQVVEQRGKPQRFRCDNGPEFTSKTFVQWCNDHNIEISYIQPGRPMQNAYIERFNGSYRRAVLDAYIFHSLDQVRTITEEWIHHYNHHRPHDALGDLSPVDFLNQNAA
jgi:putative transposase